MLTRTRPLRHRPHRDLRAAAAACALVIAFTTGCATYHPRPIDPVRTVHRVTSRRLDDPALACLAAVNQSRVGPWPPASWDLDQLTLAALCFHPDMAVVRARILSSKAAEITARARPDPTAQTQAERHSEKMDGSPWTLGFQISGTVETIGRRGLRVEAARAQTRASELDLGVTIWKLRSRVRAKLVDHLMAQRMEALLGQQERARADTVEMREKRLALGEGNRPDLEAAHVELIRIRQLRRSAEASISVTRAALAAALGLTVSALVGVPLSLSSMDPPANDVLFRADGLRGQGLQNRLDIRRALEQYAASEGAVRLEVARQYPNVSLAPGYIFDQGDRIFAFATSFLLPVVSGNRGPIAEAEAARQEERARFLALQTSVIGHIEQALARYQGARRAFDEADRALTEFSSGPVRSARSSLNAGETDRLALTSLLVEESELARSRIEALRGLHEAIGELEDALQCPLTGTGAGPRHDVQHDQSHRQLDGQDESRAGYASMVTVIAAHSVLLIGSMFSSTGPRAGVCDESSSSTSGAKNR